MAALPLPEELVAEEVVVAVSRLRAAQVVFPVLPVSVVYSHPLAWLHRAQAAVAEEEAMVALPQQEVRAALGVRAGTAVAAREMSLGLPATLGVGAILLAAVMAVFRLGVGSIDLLLTLIPEEHATRRFLSHLLPYQVQPGLILRAIGWSFVVQMAGAAAVACIGRALGITLPLAAWFAVVPLVALAMAVPISISGAGVREGLLVLLLAPYGVKTDAGVAVGLLWFLATIVTGLVGGVLFMLEPRPAARPAAELPANS